MEAARIFLDNTVLSNFAQVDRNDLITSLWPASTTTVEAREEFLAGLAVGKIRGDPWDDLPIIELTSQERELADHLSNMLGPGERTCIAAAKYRGGLFVTDDRKARRVALDMGVKISGTLGILVTCVEKRIISLEAANHLLEKMIKTGYRSPVNDLNKLLSE